jgi:small conductance mechanosensitive channel
LEESLSVKEPVTVVIEKLQGWYELLLFNLPNIVVAVVVMLIFGVLAHFTRRLVTRAFGRVADNRTLVGLAAKITSFLVVLVGFFIALGILNLDKTVTSLLAGAGVLGLALGFAFQDITANFLSGIFLSVRRPFVIGDVVELSGYFGTVQRIDLRNTVLRSPEGKLLLLPNREVFEKPMVNFTNSGQLRIDLACGVSYASDLEKVRQVTLDAVSALEDRVQERDVEFFYTGFGGSSIDFVVRVWIPYSRPMDGARIISEMVLAIKQAFDAENITIPFPIRTLDFGIEGGERLSAMFPERWSETPAAE